MIVVEFLKILKRKFNYIYVLGSIIVLIGLHYATNMVYKEISVNKVEFLYNYSLKWIVSIVVLFSILNTIFSYRKDYIDGLSKLIRYSEVSRLYNLFSKLIANYLIAVIFFIFITAFYSIFIYYMQGADGFFLINSTMKNNTALSLSLILYASSVALLVSVIFNNIYLAISLSIFPLTALTFIREFIRETYKVQIGGDIFADTFAKISEHASFESSNLIQIIIYSVCIFLISLFIKLLKNN
ncbi:MULTISPECIES: hypothetical protein [unclassified Gemella]|uniref:hypothetical protein n=1 Tax=unclassified Gemella TaxID=2624949 RepID=UPI0010749929|nr:MULTISPECIES: hypothetical protein [unclassified Gemella]MBF0710009.1 hypothetical protein [Gemella sp. GL1.1]MBF0746088.1 hypothetical protein [Gemella sp. 19428wG2_WT2a]NYS27353.1 hypothetical protein [Gemella sp. GL1]TFU60379.1 hypothetical protein E4T67_00110 [Gemella sp. WT2a]